MQKKFEFAFDTEDETGEPFAAGGTGVSDVPEVFDAGIPESFVIGNEGAEELFVAGNAGKPETVSERKKQQQPAGRENQAADSISYRMFHWKFTMEQKEELKRAMAVRVPKDVILSYFYPETSVVRMIEIRRRYK